MKPTKFPTSSVKARKSSDMKMSNSQSIKTSSKTTEPDEDTLKDQLEDILETGKERFNKSMDSWSKIRKNAMDDLRFYRGDQWTTDLQRVGSIRKEPNITVNRLPQFVKQVENELRQQQISINVYPTDEVGSDETAQIFAGLIRDIERKSYAQTAYIHAAGESGAMVPGFGFLKLETKYVNGIGHNQEILITSPHDPFKIIPDGDATEPDSSDASCWFEFDDYSVDAYKRLFPNSEMASIDLEVTGATVSKWVGGDGIRVVKYWYKEEIESIEYLLEDGTTVDNMGWYDPNESEAESDDARSPFPSKTLPDGTLAQKAVLRKRNIISTKIKWAIFNGVEILDMGDWASEDFPFVSIYGPTLIVDGERDIRGLIHNAKDSQKMLNYMASSTVRRIGSSNKSPWIVDIKSVKGYENQWKTANTENWSMLPYNSVDPDNPQRPLAPPTRADQTGQIGDLLQAAVKFENDLKATIGVYDAGLGATANDQSGIAIKTLAQQGQNSNYHFSDALQRAIQRLGYLCIKLIPKIYDTPRTVRIIGADSEEEIVKINQIFVENGQQKIHQMDMGEYGVAVSAGPAYATRKSQALEQIIKLVGSDPAVMPFIQDILVGEMDFDKAGVIQDRLKKVLMMKSPGLIDDKNETDPLPPQAQAAIQQQSQLIQQMTQELQALQAQNHQLTIEKVTKQIDHEGQIAVIHAKTEGDIRVASARAYHAMNDTRDKIDADMVKTKMNHQQHMIDVTLQAAKEGHLGDITNGSQGQ
jgi:hypothetical protein